MFIAHRNNELQDLLDRAQEELRKIESDIEESQGERVEKLKGMLAQERMRKGTTVQSSMTI